MKRKNGVKRLIAGYLGFFALVAVTVTAAVMIYGTVSKTYDGNTKAISIIMLVVCFGLTLLCTTIDGIRRKLTVDRSVEKILEATESITKGNFNVVLTPRYDYKNYDDLDLIMQNINDMAAELRKNEILKSDFISSVSHEIKTPVAVIQNYATALCRDDLPPEKRAEYLNTLAQATKRLNALVMNVLELNRLENQRLEPKTSAVRLDEMLTETVFAFEDSIEKKSLDLTCDFDEVSILSSASHLEIIWNNLLSNAIKFTEIGGKIAISLKRKGNEAVVSFKDNGIGMDEATGKRIFDKFYQGDTSRKTEGNGLGLSLVKKTVGLLGGRITVESKLKEGTTFTVTLSGVKNE